MSTPRDDAKRAGRAQREAREAREAHDSREESRSLRQSSPQDGGHPIRPQRHGSSGRLSGLDRLDRLAELDRVAEENAAAERAIRVAQEERENNAPLASPKMSGGESRAHVLIADDELEVRAVLRSLLEEEGYRVIEAKND